jgi:CO dehydrogenase/acetyl-CoA synthase delta subunit
MIPDPIQLLEDPPELTDEQWDAMELARRSRRTTPGTRTRTVNGGGIEALPAAPLYRPKGNPVVIDFPSSPSSVKNRTCRDRGVNAFEDPIDYTRKPVQEGPMGDQEPNRA